MSVQDVDLVTEAELIRDGFLPPETADLRQLRRRLEAIALYAEERLRPGDGLDPAVAFDAIAKAARDALTQSPAT